MPGREANDPCRRFAAGVKPAKSVMSSLVHYPIYTTANRRYGPHGSLKARQASGGSRRPKCALGERPQARKQKRPGRVFKGKTKETAQKTTTKTKTTTAGALALNRHGYGRPRFLRNAQSRAKLRHGKTTRAKRMPEESQMIISWSGLLSFSHTIPQRSSNHAKPIGTIP